MSGAERAAAAWGWVAVGGAAGAVARFAVSQWMAARADGGFPWATFAVNVAGSLVLGVVLAAFPAAEQWPARALLATGFCGAFTTFSTFGWETVTLLQSKAYGVAAAYVLGSVAAGLLAVVAGLLLGQRLAAA